MIGGFANRAKPKSKGHTSNSHTNFSPKPFDMSHKKAIGDSEESCLGVRERTNYIRDVPLLPQNDAPIQAKTNSNSNGVRSGDLDSQEPGTPLQSDVRQKMEAAFGTSFSDVRVHEGSDTSSIGALAYTRGRHIHFARGQYNPFSVEGQRMLGHELTHVVQQRHGDVDMPHSNQLPINDDTELEAQADKIGEQASHGERVSVNSSRGTSGKLPATLQHAPPVQRITAKQLEEAKRNLKTTGVKRNDGSKSDLGAVGIGPIDVSGKSVPRVNGMAGHEYADMVSSFRRGITSLKADLNDQGGVRGSDRNYARTSMDEWATRSYNMVSPNVNDKDSQPERLRKARQGASYRELATRSLYDNWRADSKTNQSKRGQREDAMFNQLVSMESEEDDTEVEVYDQSTKYGPEDVLQDEGKSKAYGKFAYRMNPMETRKKDKSGDVSRLSLNMEVGDSAEYAKRIRDQVSSDDTNIRQSKIMGPSNIGKRVDDAVVYLKGPNPEAGKTVAQNVTKGMGQPSVRSIPPGMEPMAPGASYAEYKKGDSTSHGNSRGDIINKAVLSKMNQDYKGQSSSMSDIVGQKISDAGYDPKQPSRIARPKPPDPLRDALAKRRRLMGYED